MTEGIARNVDIELPWILDPARHPTNGPATATIGTPATEPLLLINGLGSPRVAYDDGFVAEFTGRGFTVARFDNRDSGRATSTTGGYQLADMANDAVAVLDALDWETAHVFGMSMGGMIVQQLGIDHPQRLRTITSLMSTTGNPDYGTSSRRARAALLSPAPAERQAWLDHRVATEEVWASPDQWNPETSRAKGERLFDYGVQPANTVHQYQALAGSNREDQLGQVETPTLVMHGTEDTLLHPSGGRRTAELMANATFVELEGMGHDLPQHYWSTIADHFANHVAHSAATRATGC